MSADAVKLAGFWIDGVSVEEITGDGRLIYATRSGLEMSRSVEDLGGLKLTGYPALAEAEDSMARRDDRGALESWIRVQTRARERWLREWVSYRVIGAYDRLGEPFEAAQGYMRLVQDKAPVAYLAHPPINSILEADARVKQAIRDMVLSASPSRHGAMPEGFAEFMAALGPWDEAVTGELGSSQSDKQSLSNVENLVTKPGDAASRRAPNRPIEAEILATGLGGDRLILPSSMNLQDPVSRFLGEQRYDQALEALDRLKRKGPEKLDLWYYQRGLAQLGQALSRGERDRFLDAGLSFMHVLAHFPRSRLAGPSLIEVGYVHEQIGRPDLAGKLYDRATAMVHEEDDPRYAARLAGLIDGLEH